jgi:hypothetical protein
LQLLTKFIWKYFFPYFWGMESILFFLAFFAILNAAVHILFSKWGIINSYQLRRAKWMPKDCNFCFFFWIGFIELVVIEAYSRVHTLEGWLSCFLFALVMAIISLKFKP